MLQKFKIKYLASAVALIAVFAVLCSMLSVLCGNVAFAEGIKAWDGSADTAFEGGGTKTNPYKITSAEELYGFVKTYAGAAANKTSDNLYFELTTDIYLNDVSKENWTGKSPRVWHSITNTEYSNTSTLGFRGHFEGNGHTVYGMYYATPGTNSRVMGLFPVTSGNAVITNINLRHSYAKNSNNYSNMILGGIVGMVNKNKNGSASTVTVTKCVVDETVDFSAITNGYIGGLVGAVRSSNLVVSYCGSAVKLDNGTTPAGNKGGAMVAKNQFSAKSYKITNSYSVDSFTTSSSSISFASSISNGSLYSANATWVSKGVNLTVVETKFMKGANAQRAMTKLDWEVWRITNTGYPIIQGSTAKPESEDVAEEFIGEVGKVWSGKVATAYSGGTGTRNDPYIIETGEQLYKMVSEHCVTNDLEPGAYYKLTADIYLNDVSDPEWYNKANLNKWYSIQLTDRNTGFKGNLLGDGHKVYGIYYDVNYVKGGLIPVVGGNGSINDVHVRNSYLNGGKSSNQSYIGGIAGYVQSGAAFKINRCSVRDTFLGEANGAGGIVGGISVGNVEISSCYFIGDFPGTADYAGGIYGDSWGYANVTDCYTVGCVSIDKTNAIGGDIRYATVSQESSKNAKTVAVEIISENNIKGDNAKNAMPLLDWATTWYTVENDYPHTVVLPADAVNGIVGGLWSGKRAEDYAGGTGTQSDPYQIATGEQLYKMVSEHVVAGDVPAYYVLTEDIKLNDTTDENWYEKKGNKSWISISGYELGFAGHLDGQGHIVSGLYLKSNGSSVKCGLIPIITSKATVKNIGITDSYVDVTITNNECYASALVGYIQNWKTSLDVIEDNYPVISGCFVDSSVTVKGTFAGGLVCGTPSPAKLVNCYSICEIIGGERYGALIGNDWNGGNIVENCYAATKGFDAPAGGKPDVTGTKIEYRDTYIFGVTDGLGIQFVAMNDMLGEAAKSSMPALDFENIWQTVDNYTPILKLFYPKISKGTNGDGRTATISFVTNVEGMSLEPITAKIGSKLTLPTPVREGYRLEGWYVYPEIQCKFTETTFPYVNTILYANWEVASIIQDFEFYPNSEYDVGSDHEFYRPGVENYSANNVHGGSKAMHRLGNTDSVDQFLMNYEDELVVGGEYELVFWIMTDTQNASGDLSAEFKNWPDILESNNGVEKVMSLSTLKTGEWTKCSYSFVAKSQWISFVTTGNTSIYFDDIMMIREGEKIHPVSNNFTETEKEPTVDTPSQPEASDDANDKDTTDSDNNGSDTQKDDKDKQTSSDKKDGNTSSAEANYLWIIIPIAAVIVLAGAILLFILIKKKK
ncbi:MAG: InlB B-repeat-containing protein [Clostridia bacterium]|nr:InlB B-repeat-containing protein [Clostridia bacterium]